MRLTLAIVACAACCTASNAGQGLAGLQQKFDVAWALDAARAKAAEASERAVQVTGSAVGVLEKQAESASSQIGNVSGVFTQLGNASGAFATTLAVKGKRAAFKAVLMYLGTCDEYYAKLADVPRGLLPFLAESFQGQERGPGEADGAFCLGAARAGLDAAIETRLANRSLEERTALKWLARDRAGTICNGRFVAALGLFESIRKDFRLPYMEAVKDKLALDVLTRETLAFELLKLCGPRRNGVALFSNGPTRMDLTATSSSGSQAIAALLGGCCLLFLAVPLMARRLARPWVAEPAFVGASEDNQLLTSDYIA